MSLGPDHSAARARARRVATYLRGLAADVLEVEDTLSATNGTDPCAPLLDAVVSLQKLDHIHQRLLDLVRLCDLTAEGALSHRTVADTLHLEETRALLNALEKDAPTSQGDIHLF